MTKQEQICVPFRDVILKGTGRKTLPSTKELFHRHLKGSSVQWVRLGDIAFLDDLKEAFKGEADSDSLCKAVCEFFDGVGYRPNEIHPPYARIKMNRLKDLAVAIIKEGLGKAPHVITVGDDNTQWAGAGRHRLVLLCLLYGPDLMVPVFIHNEKTVESAKRWARTENDGNRKAQKLESSGAKVEEVLAEGGGIIEMTKGDMKMCYIAQLLMDPEKVGEEPVDLPFDIRESQAAGSGGVLGSIQKFFGGMTNMLNVTGPDREVVFPVLMKNAAIFLTEYYRSAAEICDEAMARKADKENPGPEKEQELEDLLEFRYSKFQKMKDEEGNSLSPEVIADKMLGVREGFALENEPNDDEYVALVRFCRSPMVESFESTLLSHYAMQAAGQLAFQLLYYTDDNYEDTKERKLLILAHQHQGKIESLARRFARAATDMYSFGGASGRMTKANQLPMLLCRVVDHPAKWAQVGANIGCKLSFTNKKIDWTEDQAVILRHESNNIKVVGFNTTPKIFWMDWKSVA